MRLFGSQKLSSIMLRLGMKEGEVMEHRWLNKSVETAQRRVEQQHYAVRKRTLEYDDVMNKQRSIVYELRGSILRGDQQTVHNTILDVMNDIVLTNAEKFLFDPKDGNLGAFMEWIGMMFPISVSEDELRPLMGQPQAAGELVMKRVEEAYEAKCASEDQQVLPYMERGVFLDAIDRQWQDYLRAMDDLRHGVNLRAYGQRDPLIEYKREAFHMFEQLMITIKSEVASGEFRAATVRNIRRMLAAAKTNAEDFDTPNSETEVESVQERPAPAPAPAPAASSKPAAPVTAKDAFAALMGVSPERVRTSGSRAMPPPGMPGSQLPPSGQVVGRNDPCPCGSGKKYKKCCGQNLF
jgi:preprotein translocase subunit SecA